MAESGKPKRVLGTFVLLLGAGVVIDTHALWIGMPLVGAGALLFVWGALADRGRRATHPKVVETTESVP